MDLGKIDNASIALSSLQLALGIFFLIKIILLYTNNNELCARHLGTQGCQMAKFDPLLSVDCDRVEGVGAQSKERKGSNFAA